MMKIWFISGIKFVDQIGSFYSAGGIRFEVVNQLFFLGGIEAENVVVEE